MSDLLHKCQICAALIDAEDLFCANCGTEAQQPERESKDHVRTATHNFVCTGCGASMSYDAGSGTLRCPFCGSEQLEAQRDIQVLAAQRVVPFQLDRGAARDAMRAWLGRGFWRPHDLSSRATVTQMVPVYVPYWVFQASTHTYWTADTSQTPPGAQGDWFPLHGEHRGTYADVLVGASHALTPAETAAIAPFELSAAVAPDQVDLENTTVEQFAVQRKYARPLARQGLEERERLACQNAYIPGRSRNVLVNVRVQGLSSEPVLLPVWIMVYRYQEKVYRFLLNGQSGKATGAAPVSWRKTVMIVSAVLLAIMMALACLGILGGAIGLSDRAGDSPVEYLRYASRSDLV